MVACANTRFLDEVAAVIRDVGVVKHKSQKVYDVGCGESKKVYHIMVGL